MTARTNAQPAAPYWSWPGFFEGMRITLPFMPGSIMMTTALGALAAQKGLSGLDTAIMSATVYSGAAQLLALEIWPVRFTATALVAIAFVTLTVNLRFVLMSAAMRPWFGSLPAWQAYPALFFTTDTTWLIAMRYRAEGGSDAAVYVGSGAVLWASWVAATTVGYQIGILIAEPRRFALDLILPIFFTALFLPLWRGAKRALAWAIAGVVAVLASFILPGWWFIVIGALAGGVAGGFVNDDQ